MLLALLRAVDLLVRVIRDGQSLGDGQVATGRCLLLSLLVVLAEQRILTRTKFMRRRTVLVVFSYTFEG